MNNQISPSYWRLTDIDGPPRLTNGTTGINLDEVPNLIAERNALRIALQEAIIAIECEIALRERYKENIHARLAIALPKLKAALAQKGPL